MNPALVCAGRALVALALRDLNNLTADQTFRNAAVIAGLPDLLAALEIAAERLSARGHHMGAREARAVIARVLCRTER